MAKECGPFHFCVHTAVIVTSKKIMVPVIKNLDGSVGQVSVFLQFQHPYFPLTIFYYLVTLQPFQEILPSGLLEAQLSA